MKQQNACQQPIKKQPVHGGECVTYLHTHSYATWAAALCVDLNANLFVLARVDSGWVMVKRDGMGEVEGERDGGCRFFSCFHKSLVAMQ